MNDGVVVVRLALGEWSKRLHVICTAVIPVMAKVVCNLMVAGACHVQHIHSNGLNALHKLITSLKRRGKEAQLSQITQHTHDTLNTHSHSQHQIHILIRTHHTTIVVKVIGKVAHMDDSHDVSLSTQSSGHLDSLKLTHITCTCEGAREGGSLLPGQPHG
jgi:hypothetical protein